MKKLCIISALCCLAAASLHAQDVDRKDLIMVGTDTLSVEQPDGDRVITITRKKETFSIDVGGFDIRIGGDANNGMEFPAQPTKAKESTYSPGRRLSIGNLQFGFIGLGGDPEFMELRGARSISFAFDITLDVPLDRQNTVRFRTGFRPRWDNYVFSDKITVGMADGVLTPLPLDDEYRFPMEKGYKKSKLSSFAVDVPVLFEFRLAQKIRLTTGLYGGVVLGDRTKVKFPKHKDKGDFGFNTFRAGATVRLEVWRVGAFVDYNFTPLFKSGKGPRTQPYTIGIIL